MEASETNSDAGSEEEDGPEAAARYEWQDMLSNVLQGDVLKSEKTRISTASLSTTSLANVEFASGGNSSKRQRAYAIWLLVRAKVRGRSPEEESRYIEEARTQVDVVLEEVVKFRVVDLIPPPGGPAIDYVIRQNNAADQVAALLKRVDWCESLYPSTKALALEKERVGHAEVVGRLEALRSWQQITRRLEVTIGILKMWTGSDWEKLSTSQSNEGGTPPALAFVEVIVREDSLQATFEKRLLSDLYSLVHVAKSAMIDLSPDFVAMNLPGFTADLLALAFFPSRLAQEALRTRLESVAKINEPSVVLIDQLTGEDRKSVV